MKIIDKIKEIFLNSIPILLMIYLITIIKDDVILTLTYVIIIATSLLIKRENKDILIFTFGFFIMIIAEYIFINTGVETFNRSNIFGMPS